MKLSIPCVALLALLSTSSSSWAQEAKPNVVIMMTDNLGWGELGVYGGGALRGAPTPRLDRLASEGLLLQNYNVEPQCTPSRSAFMTGRHPIRSGTTKVVWGMLYGMTQWEYTLAEGFSDAGYATGMFGKWHLGDTKGRFPTDQGFDEWYGIANTTDEAQYSSQFQYDASVALVPVVQRATKGQEPTEVGPYDLEVRRTIDHELTERSIDFMKRSVDAQQPFFAFVPFTQVHLPSLPHPDFEGRTGNGPFADSMVQTDAYAGRILDAIDSLGIRDDTIVIWTSDNGPEEVAAWHGTSGPWRGHYFTALEGSLRAPFMIRWPGRIDAGGVSNEIVHTIDLLPTLARAARFEVPQDRAIDGVDQFDFLTGQSERSAREGFPAYNGDNLFAYKWRDWKVHFVELNSMFGKPQRLNVPLVYNTLRDPKESYDVAPNSTWILPVVMKRVIAFQKTLAAEPPITIGTPDPYQPSGGR
jgi:arylsulfatase